MTQPFGGGISLERGPARFHSRGQYRTQPTPSCPRRGPIALVEGGMCVWNSPPLIQLLYGLSHLDVLPGSLLGNQVCYYRNCLLPKHAPWYCSCFKSAFSNAVLLRHAAKPLLLLHLLIVTSFAGRGAFFSLLSNFLSSSHNLSSQALVYRLRKELDDARMRDKRRPLLIYRISK